MRTALAFLLLSTAAVACGDDITTPGTIRGSITGLRGTGIVLANHGDILEMSADGSFQFAAPVALGTAYDVAIVKQPTSPWQTCKVLHGQGWIEDPGQTIDVGITCKTDAFGVAGSVTGLAGSGLLLQNNGADDLEVASDGTFAFPTSVTSGEPFAVTVKQQPTGKSQTCMVTGGAGIVGGSAVDTVVVNCATDRFAVGGTITGLEGTVVLANNDGDPIEVTANGAFAFPATLESGADYDVAVASQPGVPSQTCVVTHGTGSVVDHAIESVQVDCTTNKFAVGGTVTGLDGNGLVLANNAGDALIISGNGAFQFSTPIDSGATFSVTVADQPTFLSQTCEVTGGSGVVGGGAVTTVTVNCSTNTYAVGGSISGLAGGMVTLQNNAGDEIQIMANGTFAFPATIASGASYDVTVATNPKGPSQTCTVIAGTGAVVDAAITSVEIACTVDTFAVGGTVTGLAAGDAVVLRNGGADLTVTENGAFSFPVAVASGQTYAVVIQMSPDAPIAQECTVANGSGTVGDEAVTDVIVSCATKAFAIGGSVTGLLADTSVVLTDGIEDIAMAADGTFTFAAPVSSGATYSISVKTQPTGELFCKVANGDGIVGSAPVTVTVTCGPSITRWSDGTEAWPDSACNTPNPFSGCSSHSQADGDVWATVVCQKNGYSTGTWTGNKIAGCSGETSMYHYCSGLGEDMQCWTNYEYTCAPTDQTRIEITCYP